jgi:NAD(P)H-dependent FMN reductase
MITLISGTNRPGSNTLKVASAYSEILTGLGAAHRLLSLESLPRDFAFDYFADSQSPEFKKMIETEVRPAEKFVVVIPEYNGSFPGIFKLFLDAVHPNDLKGKKAAMVGVATGRGGNLRGMDHLSGTFHYLGITVYPGLLPISRLRDSLDQHGQLSDEVVLRAMRMQAEGFLKF